ncbi:MAG: cyclic nucleotide-binding domain-containing protein [Candidatus Marinimicrobia bacterium]|nr:cyclic nucleotide-binding domain-containing protein [Candidatus Neomarinimicrobiota bacterium]
MTQKYIQQLKEYAFFRDLSLDEIKTFYPFMELHQVPKGEMIIREGDKGNFMFLLLEGEVEISQPLTLPMSPGARDTREKAFIRLTHENHPFIGEMSLIQPNVPRSANVKAVKPCIIGIFKNSDLETLAEKYPHIGAVIMKNIACKLANDLRTANQNVLKLTTALSIIMD